MADTKENKFVFNKVGCVEHLDKVEAEVKTYAGKPGMNPFTWLRQHVQPLRVRLAAGEQTEDLQKAVGAVKAVEPKI